MQRELTVRQQSNSYPGTRKATSALKHGAVSPAPIIFLDGSAIKDQNSPLFPREILVLFLGSNHIPNNKVTPTQSRLHLVTF